MWPCPHQSNSKIDSGCFAERGSGSPRPVPAKQVHVDSVVAAAGFEGELAFRGSPEPAHLVAVILALILKPLVYRNPGFLVYGFGLNTSDGGFAQGFYGRVVALGPALRTCFGGWRGSAWLVGELTIGGPINVGFIKTIHAPIGERATRLPIRV